MLIVTQVFVSRCNIRTFTIFHHLACANINTCSIPVHYIHWVAQYMLNDVLCNSQAYTKGYSICGSPRMCTENAGVSECYIGSSGSRLTITTAVCGTSIAWTSLLNMVVGWQCTDQGGGADPSDTLSMAWPRKGSCSQDTPRDSVNVSSLYWIRNDHRDIEK